MELDEIFRAFDKKTRESFQVWQQDLGKGIEGQGAGFSEFLGVLPAFAQDTNKVLEVLNSQERATREAIKNTGVVFDALTERGDQLAQWISNSNDLLRTTGRRDDSIRALFQAFPTFIDESNATLKALGAYAENTEPVLRALTPAAAQLSNVLEQLSAIAPDFNEFFIGLNRVIPASVKGLPASSRFLDDTRDLFVQLDPVLRNFNPFFEYLALFKREIAAMLANDTAVTQATDQIGEDRVPLPAAHEPGEPGGGRDLPAAPGLAPRQPVLQVRRLRPDQGRPAGLRPGPVLHERLPDARSRHGHHARGAAQPHPAVRPEQREHGRAAVPQAEPVHLRRPHHGLPAGDRDARSRAP